MQMKKISGISFGKNPESDWKIVFFSALTLAILTIALNVYVYIKIDKGEIFVVEGAGEGSGNTLNIEKLEETVEYYQSKAANFQRIIRQDASAPVSDPSL